MNRSPFRPRLVPNGQTLFQIVDQHPGLFDDLKADALLWLDIALRRNRIAAFLRAVRRALPLEQRIVFTRDLFAAYRVGALSR